MKLMFNQRQTLVPAIAELIQFFIVNFEKSRAAQVALRFVQKVDFSRELVAQLEEAVRESAKMQIDAETKLEEYFSRMEMQKGEGLRVVKHFNRKILLMTTMLRQRQLRPWMMANNQEKYQSDYTMNRRSQVH